MGSNKIFVPLKKYRSRQKFCQKKFWFQTNYDIEKKNWSKENFGFKRNFRSEIFFQYQFFQEGDIFHISNILIK